MNTKTPTLPTNAGSPFQAFMQAVRVARSAGLLLLGQIVNIVATTVLGLVIVRALGQTEYGHYAIATAFVGIFASLASFGLDRIVTREVAADPRYAYDVYVRALPWRISSAVGCVILVMCASFIMGYEWSVRGLICVVAVTSSVSAVSELPRSVMRGFERMDLDLLSRVVQRCSSLTLVFAVLGMAGNMLQVMIVLCLGELLGLVTTCVLLKRVLHKGHRHKTRTGFALLRQAWPLALSDMCVAAYLRIGVVVLSSYVAAASVGNYAAAYNLLSPFFVLPLALTGALFPLLARDIHANPAHFMCLYTHGLRTVAIAGALLSIGIGICARPIVDILLGAAFTDAVLIIRLLFPIVSIVFLNTYLSNTLVVLGRQRVLFIVTLSNLLLTVMICPLLIAYLGIGGAAIAELLREAVTLIVCSLLVSQHTGTAWLRWIVIAAGVPLAFVAILHA